MEKYEIRNDKGQNICPGILILHYGKQWKSILDRLHHRHDGYIITITYQGTRFRVHRNIQQIPDNLRKSSHLHVLAA